jgi:hypothetical protein
MLQWVSICHLWIQIWHDLVVFSGLPLNMFSGLVFTIVLAWGAILSVIFFQLQHSRAQFGKILALNGAVFQGDTPRNIFFG